ncbi:MAG: DMT family transporter [Desulfosarcina sp.]|nr:DMT family transporter [Desulfobacterales bacterium]
MARISVSQFVRSPYLLLTFAVLFWSGNFILGRAVRTEVPPVGLAFWRWAVAALLVLGPALPWLKRDWRTIQQNRPIILLLSALGVTIFNTLVYAGLQHTIALNAFLMQALMPVMIVAMSFILFRDRVVTLQTFGFAFALAGAVTIIIQGDPQKLRTLVFNPGDILIFTAVVAYAGYSVLLRKRPPIHPLSFVAITFVAGALMLLPFYIWETIHLRAVRWDGVTIATIVYVAVFPSIVSFLCFNRGVELIGANRAGFFLYLMPLFGGFMALVFLGEELEWFHGAGMALIVTGIFLAVRGRR